jgi:hypothetical protein
MRRLVVVCALLVPLAARADVKGMTWADTAVPLPGEQELTPECMLVVMRPQLGGFFRWRQFLTEATEVSTSDPRTQAAVADASKWVRLVLRPEWVPEQLDAFVTCSAKAVPGAGPTPFDAPTKYDAVGIRYSVGGSAIQVVQTSYHMAIVIVPRASKVEAYPIVGDLRPVNRVVATFLQEAPEIIGNSMKQCAYKDGVVSGGAADWWRNEWYTSVFWFWDQRVFAFTCPKVRGGPALEGPRLPDWFK